jgi:hypothetical protein
VDIQGFYSRLRLPFRVRRMHRFATCLDITPQTSVLDVGGKPDIWALCPVRPKLTLLNIRGYQTDMRLVVADGVRLPFQDDSFDVVFSNSLIEHLPTGSWRDFADECRRVGRHLWIQAPNQHFPVEPHLMTPVIHWLPRRWKSRLARWSVRALIPGTDSDAVIKIADEVQMPNARQMRELFPGARLLEERWLGLAKSLIIVE